MNTLDREKFFEDFNNGLHRLGRFTLIAGICSHPVLPGIHPSIPTVTSTANGAGEAPAQLKIEHLTV